MVRRCLVIFALIVVADRTRSVDPTELKLIHILAAHAVEHPHDPRFTTLERLAIDPSNYAATNSLYFEDMTNEEKLLTYQLGLRLRDRYNEFLGDVYTSEVTKTYTTDKDFSKISALLVNAALWQPAASQRWFNDLNWQPLPFDYIGAERDIMMMGRLCPTYENATTAVRNSPEIQSMMRQHGKLFAYIRNESGLDVRDSRDIAHLYQSLQARENRNLKLPSWSEGLFPYGEILNLTLLEYDILSWTDIQKRLNGGVLIRKILADCAACVDKYLANERRSIVYSGDVNLFVGVLRALNTWHPHVPNVGAALIFELRRDNKTDSYRVKILYDIGEQNITIPLEIPGCRGVEASGGCEFFKFVHLLRNVLPYNEFATCGRPIEPVDTTEDFQSSSFLNRARKSSASHTVIPIFVTLPILSLIHTKLRAG